MTATRKLSRTLLISVVVVITTSAVCATPAAAAPGSAHRYATWGPSMTIGGPNFNNQTIRMVVHTTIGGNSVRIRLSNQRSTTPLAVGAVDVAEQATMATAVAGTHHTVTFSHAKAVNIPTGAEVLSDPIAMTVGADRSLLVSVDLPQATTSATWHSDAFDTTYLSVPGNHTRDDGDGNFITATTSWYYLSGVDVMSPKAAGTVVTFGDSITDGYLATPGNDHRWPDRLAERLVRGGPRGAAVVNAGIGGNRVLSGGVIPIFGIPALARLDRDVLAVPGVTHLVVLEGINDIGGKPTPSAEALIAGFRQIVARAHEHGVKVILGTILPYGGAAYFRPDGEATRSSVNGWIRSQHEADGVVDFDAAVRDPAEPSRMRKELQSGDWLHPNDAGYRAMGEAVSLMLFR